MTRGAEPRCRRLGGALAAALLTLHCGPGDISLRQVSHSKLGAYEAALTATSDGFLASWFDIRDGNAEIYVRRIDAAGEPSGAEMRLTTDGAESYEPSIDAASDGSTIVAWYDKSEDGALIGRLGVWTVDGRHRWTIALPSPSRNPAVCVDGTTVFVSWIQKDAGGSAESLWIGEWTLGGDPIRPPRRIGAAHSTTWNVNMDLAAGGVAWVAWDALAGIQTSELFLAHVDPHEITVRQLTLDDGHESKYPDVAVRGDRIAVAWYDARDGNTEVYLFAGAIDIEPVDRGSFRVTNTPAESIGAYVAWNGDRLGLAWSDASTGDHEVYFQSFDRSARPLAPPKRITNNTTSSLIPAIEPWGAGFALAWNEYLPSSEPHGGRSEIAFAIVR